MIDGNVPPGLVIPLVLTFKWRRRGAVWRPAGWRDVFWRVAGLVLSFLTDAGGIAGGLILIGGIC